MSEVQQTDPNKTDILRMATDIVAAYVARHSVDKTELPGLINQVVDSLNSVGNGQVQAEVPRKPAVSVKKSITPDYLVCLEDGKQLKMLKRHLRTAYNLTPEEYRARWNLPPDYPMVAPNYAKKRSEFAKKIGLGRKDD